MYMSNGKMAIICTRRKALAITARTSFGAKKLRKLSGIFDFSKLGNVT